MKLDPPTVKSPVFEKEQLESFIVHAENDKVNFMAKVVSMFSVEMPRVFFYCASFQKPNVRKSTTSG